MKTGDLTKALMFILPLTERLTNPLFPDFKESRIWDAVFHYFHRPQIWLFHLVEELPNNHWNKPHQKQVTLPTAAEHRPTLDAKWLWQTDCRHEPSRAVPCLMHLVSQTSGGAEHAFESQLSGLWAVGLSHLGACGLFGQSPLTWLLLLLLFISVLTLLSKCIQRVFLGGRESRAPMKRRCA